MNYKSLDDQITETEALIIRLKADKASREEESWKAFVFQSRACYNNYGLAIAFARTAEEAREAISKEAHRICLECIMSSLSLTLYFELSRHDYPTTPLAYIRMADKDYLPF